MNEILIYLDYNYIKTIKYVWIFICRFNIKQYSCNLTLINVL